MFQLLRRRQPPSSWTRRHGAEEAFIIGVILLYWGYIGVIWGNIGVILGLYCYVAVILGLYCYIAVILGIYVGYVLVILGLYQGRARPWSS